MLKFKNPLNLYIVRYLQLLWRWGIKFTRVYSSYLEQRQFTLYNSNPTPFCSRRAGRLNGTALSSSEGATMVPISQIQTPLVKKLSQTLLYRA